MILLLATVIVSTSATTAAIAARDLDSRSVLRNAAEAALQNASITANNSTTNNVLETKRNVANAVVGVMTSDSSSGRQTGEIQWRWYTEQVVFPGKVTGYYVYATGYSTKTGGVNEGVTLRAQFHPVVVTGANSTDGQNIEYYIGVSSIFQYGITGTSTGSSVTVEDTAKIYTGDSNYGNTPSGTSSDGALIATNGTVKVNGTTSGVKYASIDKASVGGPCTGTGCAALGTLARGYAIDSGMISTQGNAATCTNNMGLWRASLNGGVLNIPQDSCVTGLVFDVNTTIPANWSSETPLRIFNSGDTAVDKGVAVNTTNSPQSLTIYSTSGKFSSGITGAGTGNNSFTGYFASVTGQCEVGASTKYFGALTCGTVILRANSIFYLDLASRGLSLTHTYAGQRKIWIVDFVEEL